MDRIKHSLKERTKKYFSNTKEKLLLSHNKWITAINSYSDEDGNITITMDNAQILHSIDISEKLLINIDKLDIIKRLTQLINKAIIQTGKLAVREVQDAISTDEYEEIVSEENIEVRNQMELLNRNNNQSVQDMSSKLIKINSIGNMVAVIVYGNRLIHSLDINKEGFSLNNKSRIEKELMETINEAMHQVLIETQEIITRNEEEFFNSIIQD
jgi:DNA-binding protein YbaB